MKFRLLTALMLFPVWLQAEWIGVADLTLGEQTDPGFGFGAYQHNPGRPGFYASMVLPFDRGNEYPNLRTDTFSDSVVSQYQKAMSFNVGITLTPVRFLTFYAGGGPGFSEGMAEMYDANRVLSYSGYYQVPVPENDEFVWNLNGGVLLNWSTFSMHLGYHQMHQSLTLGIGTGF